MLLPADTMVLTTPAATMPATPTYTMPPATTIFATRMVELRRDISSQVSYDAACVDIVGSLSCDSAYISCLDSVDGIYATETDYDYTSLDNAITSCYCNYGVQYLSCYYSAIERPACLSYFGTYDWSSYETYWFQDYCGTVPATILGAGTTTKAGKAGKAPTSVSLDLQSVHVVTIESEPPIPTYTYSPIYQSTGNLLNNECASTQFTLIEDINTVYWAAYIGCASDQPQCCPWTAASAFFAATVTGNTTVTVTSTVTATAGGSEPALNAFPAAANTDQSILKSCASDYYSISGACCPSNYWPFTRDLGGQTPCYSSLKAVTDAPTLTAGLIGQPTATEKPTSAVVNVVWAMSYPVKSKGGLAKGAIAGIVIGVVIVLAALGLLSFCVFRYRRKNKQLQQAQQAPQPQAQTQFAPPQQQVQQAYAMPVQQDPGKLPGMVQVQGAAPAGVYAYPPPQQELAAGYVQGNGTSIGVSTPTPVSMLAPQSTGTTVGELSGGVTNVSSNPTPIAEADESAFQQQQVYQQQYYNQQAPVQQYGYAQEAQGYPVYQPGAQQPVVYAPPGQPQAHQARFVEMSDGQHVLSSPVEGQPAAAQPQQGAPQGHQPT